MAQDSNTLSSGLRHPSSKEDGAGQRCSECGLRTRRYRRLINQSDTVPDRFPRPGLTLSEMHKLSTVLRHPSSDVPESDARSV